MSIKPILSFLFMLLLPIGVFAQLNQRYLNYIDKYKDLAIEQMERYRIPASITLAQGLFESGAGESTLARKSNNHFGIKCGSTWSGPYVHHDDDARGEKFRVYRSVRESYEDHSLFLRGKSRYAALFNLKVTDYKGWAHGLKRAGYATNPNYAQRLISLIEQYQLYRYDEKRGRYPVSSAKVGAMHQVAYCNGLKYIKARRGESLSVIAKEFGLKEKKLRKYNDLYKGYVLKEGDIIYLQPKKKRAAKANGKQPHIVRVGDSMYYVSQLYGIRLKNLYRMNHLHAEDAMPPVGYPIRIR